ncbi:hypothetical protein BH09PAT2_BH09PAT2_06730 [soil metagenome]
MTSRKLWKLYIMPFLIVLIMMGVDYIKTSYYGNQSFQEVVKDSNALSEVDQRVFEEAEVAKAVDGDTIQLTTGEKVRYVGMDTPETKHPTKGVQCFGHEASDKNKALVEGKKILMEKDVSETDRYGRLLRYIYLPNPEATHEALFVNEYLVEQGYAHVLTYPPYVKYNQIMLDAETVARTNNRGLWSKCN